MSNVTCVRHFANEDLYTSLKELNLELSSLRAKRDELSQIIADTYDDPAAAKLVDREECIREQVGVVKAINDIIFMKADILDQLLNRKGV